MSNNHVHPVLASILDSQFPQESVNEEQNSQPDLSNPTLPAPEWRVGREDRGMGRFGYAVLEGDESEQNVVAKCTSADAAFSIVNDHNAHDALVAALQATLNAMRNARDTWPNYEPDVQWVTAWDAARAALALANKESK